MNGKRCRQGFSPGALGPREVNDISGLGGRGRGGRHCTKRVEKDVVITFEHKGAVPVEGRIDHTSSGLLKNLKKIKIMTVKIKILGVGGER